MELTTIIDLGIIPTVEQQHCPAVDPMTLPVCPSLVSPINDHCVGYSSLSFLYRIKWQLSAISDCHPCHSGWPISQSSCYLQCNQERIYFLTFHLLILKHVQQEDEFLHINIFCIDCFSIFFISGLCSFIEWWY